MFKVGDIVKFKSLFHLCLITEKNTTSFRSDVIYPVFYEHSRLYSILEMEDLFTLYSSILRAENE